MACLIGDIGGTHARFAISTSEGKIECMRICQNSAYSSLLSSVQDYLKDPALKSLPRASKAALAIAAPLSGDEVILTNRDWSFSRERLQADLGFKIDLYNDFSAVALAVPYLQAEDKLELGDSRPASDGAIAVIGPGTGLGVAGLIRRADRWIELCSEGGHATMAAATREESQVLDLLRVRWDHVSAERVLSGPGLANIYEALCIVHGVVTQKLTAEQITAALADCEGAKEQTNLLCAKAFDLFCAMLGTMASNVALMLGATGGVYIAGGILPRVKNRFAASKFRTRFEHKGRLTGYMTSIPTYLVLHQAPALLGLIHAQSRYEAK